MTTPVPSDPHDGIDPTADREAEAAARDQSSDVARGGQSSGIVDTGPAPGDEQPSLAVDGGASAVTRCPASARARRTWRTRCPATPDPSTRAAGTDEPYAGAGGSSVATSSTCSVIGNRSKARRSASVQPASSSTRGRARTTPGRRRRRPSAAAAARPARGRPPGRRRRAAGRARRGRRPPACASELRRRPARCGCARAAGRRCCARRRRTARGVGLDGHAPRRSARPARRAAAANSPTPA